MSSGKIGVMSTTVDSADVIAHEPSGHHKNGQLGGEGRVGELEPICLCGTFVKITVSICTLEQY